ncbi:unnamed protein product, partial [Ectocarpus sp. 12 AP-2014]
TGKIVSTTLVTGFSTIIVLGASSELQADGRDVLCATRVPLHVSGHNSVSCFGGKKARNIGFVSVQVIMALPTPTVARFPHGCGSHTTVRDSDHTSMCLYTWNS